MRIEKSLLIQRVLLVWFWVLTCTGFVNDEFLGSNRVVRSISLLFTDATILLLALWTIRNKWDMAVLISYVAISYWSTCIVNHLSWLMWINGSRVFFGLIFVIPVLRYLWQNEYRRERFIKEMDKTLLIYLCVQAVCIVWQFLRYGAGDEVGGSLGFDFSGVASFSIYLISFYLLHKRIDNDHFVYSIKENWYLIALLFPTFLNETKISFILIILYFLFLPNIDRKWFSRMAMVVPITLIFIVGGMTVYLDTVDDPFGGIDLVEYLAGQDLEYETGAAEYHSLNSEETYDIPRIAKLAFLSVVFEENPRNLYSGFGVGIYKGYTNLSINPFAETYDWLVVGTNPYAYHVILQLGVVGAIWAIILFVGCFVCPIGIATERDVSMQLMFMSCVVIMLIYSDYWSNLAFSFIVLLFLCLSWRVPEQRDSGIVESMS